ncbi:methyltransferase domain-containing protein, partial [Candidatus Woesearchaeota archaeon]|nr:methyltransferase domain-containing protein [Candidatus Woesearchaeota archaeon]
MIYEPREDSYLLAKWAKKLSFGKVLDMGSGSGIQAETALASPKVTSVLAADINPEAVALLTSKGIYAVQSDLFSKISDKLGKFDTIIF